MTRRPVLWLAAPLAALTFALAACSSSGAHTASPAASGAPEVIGPAPAAVQNPPADDSVDAGFARDMSVHHAQAVDMAMTVRDLTSDDSVRKLAYDIALTQQEQIGEMTGWLKLWGLNPTSSAPPMQWMGMGTGVGTGTSAPSSASPSTSPGAQAPLMPGMATQAQLNQLATLHGRDAEVMFLQLMIAHHEGGLPMAQYAEQHAQTQQVRDLARTMVQSQTSEVTLMKQMLAQRGVAS